MYFIAKLIILILVPQIYKSQKLELRNLQEDPIVLIKLKSCKIQTGVIRIVHPINLTSLETTIELISKIVSNKLNDKLELYNIIDQKYKKLINNFHQIKPTSSTRHKRWDTLGSAWKWLAGNPDAEDLRVINGSMNELVDANNQQFMINEQFNKRIELITNTVNRALKNTTIANTIILTEIEMIATIINIDTINTILEDIQDAIIQTKLELTSNKILTIKEILMIKDLLTNQGINITIPDEALQYVTPKIAANKETLLYILQVPKLEEDESMLVMIIPLVINNTIIGTYPQHLIKSKNKIFTTLNHNDFVQKHSQIKEFQDGCIKPLVMGTKSQCNVTAEKETTIQYITEDKLLINNAKNETLHSNCGPSDRKLTGNFLIDFFNCSITFNKKKFQSYEVKSEVQVIQGALHNVEATRYLVSDLNFDLIKQDNIENRKQLKHVYLKQANHHTWIWTLSGGTSVSLVCILILIIHVNIIRRRTNVTIKNTSGASPEISNKEHTTLSLDLLEKYGIKPKTEDALSPPPGGVILTK